jgi:inner membrane protein
MASAFGHAFAALALGSSFSKPARSARLLWLGMICAVLPDADVISFAFGIPYESFWGHRGFSHSLAFALLLAMVVTALFFRSATASRSKLILYFFLCTASHGLLDALTSGGLGVAFFSPFNNERFFFPCRPIKVSPIGVGNFFSEWGLKVLSSELIWIGIPFGIYMIVAGLARKRRPG